MTSSPILGKAPINLQSTQQALNLIRDMREKRKKENPVTIYELVRSIHSLFKSCNAKKGENHLTISSEDYLGSNRESIEDMLIFIKNKITVFIETGNLNDVNPQVRSQIQGKGKQKSIQLLQESLAKKQEQLNRITESIKSNQQQSKAMQIKLLNNMKRLNVQLQQKDAQLSEFKKIMEEKQEEFQQLSKLNQKQYKKIRKLQEDLYDAQMELEQKNQELQAERQCADFLEKKVSKMLDHDAHVNHEKDDIELVKDYRPKQRFTKNLEIGIQTGEDFNQNFNGNEQFYEQENSQNSSILTQSKQNKYIQSIQRLTSELGEAYQRINDLTRQLQQSGECRTVETIASEHMNIDSGKKDRIGQQESNKSGKQKSKSSYFSKFWK